ncbi:hypothetical protein [Rhodoferax sp.]|uniref:hypothetical protein n=1 Tax=Rhodoferax sp. TaxID=50421 RepID=UPI00274F6E0D|nr:hypothetical protein [Rhodoferax sp.]
MAGDAWLQNGPGWTLADVSANHDKSPLHVAFSAFGGTGMVNGACVSVIIRAF